MRTTSRDHCRCCITCSFPGSNHSPKPTIPTHRTTNASYCNTLQPYNASIYFI
ncbi:hypothetical protein PspLS_11484 [Pyricularia sp. CBS 133598]|nr:hypothetical protein PspLS_11484 [Pyricularia sp. CBS 133598]